VPGGFLAVDGQHASAALAEARAVRSPFEHDRVTARLQLRPLPHRALEVEQVVQEHDPASIEADFALAEEQAIAAEAAALGDDHAFRSALGNLDFGRDR